MRIGGKIMPKIQNKILLIFAVMMLVLGTGVVQAANYPINAPLKQSIKRSTYNKLLSKEVELESEYDLRDDVEIRVKNQRKSQSCWAFSFSSLLEISAEKQQGKRAKEYSPMHLEYMTAKMFNRTKGSGAGPRLSTAYAVSGNGPVEESKLPFESVYSEQNDVGIFKEVTLSQLQQPVDARIRQTREFPTIYKKMNADEDGIDYYKQDIKEDKYKYTEEEIKVARNLIKQHIKTYGAVSANIYMDTNYLAQTGAYHYNDYNNKKNSNHVVTIIGWNDEYSIENYKEGAGPSEDGAYIALNSYGEDWGDAGYMYISYEDACVEEAMVGIKQIAEFENGKKDYDKIYQHDELGMNMGIPLGGTSLYAANKYTKEDDKEEYLQEVGLYIYATTGVKVYVNSASDDIEKAELMASVSEPLETGYHTIKLPTPVKLTGEKFVIKIEYTNQEGAYIPIECNYKTAGINASDFYNNATANDNECFISKDGVEWSDVNKTSITQAGETHSLKDSSTCIKAFTTYNEKQEEGDDKPTTQKVEKIELNETDLEVEVGDKFNLEVTFYPANATNKNVTWKTSNKEVAVVDQNGIITTIAEGTAVITAITEDGEKTASCKLTVEAKDEDDPDDIYFDDDEDSDSDSDDYDDDDDTLYDDEDSDEEFEDNTIYKGDGSSQSASIPKTGSDIIFIIVTALTTVTIVATIAYQKYKRLKGIK